MLKDALGDWRGNERELSAQIDADPFDADAWCSRAAVRSAAGDMRGALEDLTRAIDLGLRFRECVIAHGNRGMIRLELGDYPGAIEDFSEVIRRRPRRISLMRTALNRRASAKEKLGDADGALADRQAAMLADPACEDNNQIMED